MLTTILCDVTFGWTIGGFLWMVVMAHLYPDMTIGQIKTTILLAGPLSWAAFLAFSIIRRIKHDR